MSLVSQMSQGMHFIMCVLIVFNTHFHIYSHLLQKRSGGAQEGGRGSVPRLLHSGPISHRCCGGRRDTSQQRCRGFHGRCLPEHHRWGCSRWVPDIRRYVRCPSSKVTMLRRRHVRAPRIPASQAQGKYLSKNSLLVFASLDHCWYSTGMFCLSAVKFSRYWTFKIQKVSPYDAFCSLSDSKRVVLSSS